MVSRRNSLARGRAWPVTTGDIRNALGDLFDAVSLIWYDSDHLRDDPVWAHWKTEASRHPSAFAADRNTITVWLTPTSAGEAGAIGGVMRDQILPQLVEWLEYSFDQDVSWQARNHSKRWTVRNGQVTTETHDQSPKRIKRR
jgi:hypothetical protein